MAVLTREGGIGSHQSSLSYHRTYNVIEETRRDSSTLGMSTFTFPKKKEKYDQSGSR